MRARYSGQLCGDEKNIFATQEHDSDNEIVEGKEAAKLRIMIGRGTKQGFSDAAAYLEKLRTDGWSIARLQCVQSKATLGMKF